MPAFLSFAVVVWLFGAVSSLTDWMLVVLPDSWTRASGGAGGPLWYWRIVSLLITVLLVAIVGRITRHYVGSRLVRLADDVMMRIPLFNKIYGTVKQVNEAFSSGSKSSFKGVVMIEFPQEGHYSVGFLTGEPIEEMHPQGGSRLCAVFIPTTPNPTSGFLVMAPVGKVKRLNMSVPDGIKYIVSLGALTTYPKPPVTEIPA